MPLKDPKSKPEDRRPYGQGKNNYIRLAVTDEVNAIIRSKAKEQGKSITDYIVSLVRRDNMKIYVADREAGNIIEQVQSVEEGLKLIAEFEQQDKQDGTFEENFYDVVDEDRCSLT